MKLARCLIARASWSRFGNENHSTDTGLTCRRYGRTRSASAVLPAEIALYAEGGQLAEQALAGAGEYELKLQLRGFPTTSS